MIQLTCVTDNREEEVEVTLENVEFPVCIGDSHNNFWLLGREYDLTGTFYKYMAVNLNDGSILHCGKSGDTKKWMKDEGYEFRSSNIILE